MVGLSEPGPRLVPAQPQLGPRLLARLDPGRDQYLQRLRLLQRVVWRDNLGENGASIRMRRSGRVWA